MKDLKKKLLTKSLFIRRAILELITSSGKGHIGGAFSSADILTALYYGDILRFDPKNPSWDMRDRFILSKGHAGALLYVVLSDLGFFAESELESCCDKGSMLGGHPDIHVPGVEVTSGSLGNGLGIGAGLALCAKIDQKDFKSVVLMGDGECNEGAVWEAALFAAHHKLNNLIGIIDYNHQCANDYNRDCIELESLNSKWESFGWDVKEIDGHSFSDIIPAFREFHGRNSNKPLMIIANTIKGKGVSFMEGELKWHHGVPKGDELITARKELSFCG